MENFTRFRDEKYKNWLKAAESLYILRHNIRGFVENETEAYHKSLQEKLKGAICNEKCDLKKCPPSPKKLPICDTCELWKNEILHSRPGKASGVHWNNCHPYLWPTEKWEVAKVYMPRGQTDHQTFDQFDISAILNFMNHCKHFKRFFQGPLLIEIIRMRNTVMHSPDFRLNENQRKNGVDNILKLAQILDSHVEGELYKTVHEAILKFSTMLENCLGQDSDGKTENIQLLDREQQALKEKIESLTQRYEADQNEDIKGELLGMRNFLEQNKDLLENLRPQMSRLDEIQEKVNKHDDQIGQLSDRVGDLEKSAAEDGSDSMFTSETLLFKNHLIEQSRKRKWADPVFTDELEAEGFRGQVEVNGRIFKGSRVCKKRVTAHQEAAKIALDSLKNEFASTEELSVSASTTSSIVFYGRVTVVLDKVVVSDGFVKKEEAIESAYSKLARLLGLKDLQEDNTFRTSVLAHLKKCCVKPPKEEIQEKDQIFCELQLKESFTFNVKDGSSNKKKAEQQAASVAIQKLSTFLNSSSLKPQNENYKSFLKERLDALGMDGAKCEYNAEQEKATEEQEGPNSSEDASHSYMDKSNTQMCFTQTSTHQEITKTALDEESTSAAIPSVTTLTSSSSTLFYGTVTVVLNTNKEICSDGFVTKEEAIESAYKKCANLFGLKDMGTNFRAAVLAHFERCHVKPPQELTQECSQGNKIICKLQLMECFTFSDDVGCTIKKKAEQQAAKIALQQLSPFLNCGFSADSIKNYKGFLKERLEALGIDSNKTEYKTQQKKIAEELEGSGASGDTSHNAQAHLCLEGEELKPDFTTVAVFSTQTRQPEQQNASLQPKDSLAVNQPPSTSQSSCAAETPDVSLSIIPSEVLNEDYAEIHSLLTVHHLKPPSVIVEVFSTDQNVSLRLDIVLDKFTFTNPSDYNSKKDAIRKSYYLLGCALGIFPQNTDEIKATMLVKQDFSQKSLPPAKENLDGEKAPFRCSIGEITYSLMYEGQGSTEDEAKRDALQKALLTLPSLFGYSDLPMSSSIEETEGQINTLLRKSGQKDLTFSHKRDKHKVSVTLQFRDHAMTSKMQRNKKENRNLLSKRILGLLGVKTEPQCPSLRNCVDDWFKQKGLQQPVFTEEAQECKAMFSVQLSCTHPDWEENLEAAKMKLVQELAKRFRYLNDRTAED